MKNKACKVDVITIRYGVRIVKENEENKLADGSAARLVEAFGKNVFGEGSSDEVEYDAPASR